MHKLARHYFENSGLWRCRWLCWRRICWWWLCRWIWIYCRWRPLQPVQRRGVGAAFPRVHITGGSFIIFFQWLCMIHSSRMEVGSSRMHPLKTREMTSSTKRRRCTMRCSGADPRKYFLALSSSGQKIGCWFWLNTKQPDLGAATIYWRTRDLSFVVRLTYF